MDGTAAVTFRQSVDFYVAVMIDTGRRSHTSPLHFRLSVAFRVGLVIESKRLYYATSVNRDPL